MLGDVETDTFLLFGYPHADSLVDNDCKYVCYNKRIDKGSESTRNICYKLVDISFQKP